MTEDISIDTSSLSDLDLVTKVRLIKTCLLSHPVWVNVPSFIPTLDHLGEGAQELEDAYNAVRNRDFGKAAERKAARTALVAKYGKVGRYVDLACNGDRRLLKTTGFDLKGEKLKGKAKPVPSLFSVLPAPMVTLSHGPDGVIIARAKKVPGAACYVVQITMGDPSVEDSWGEYGSFPSCAGIEIKPLTPGQMCAVRMCCMAGTERGPWSIPRVLMVH